MSRPGIGSTTTTEIMATDKEGAAVLANNQHQHQQSLDSLLLSMRLFCLFAFLLWFICAAFLYRQQLNLKNKRRQDDKFIELEPNDEGEAQYLVSFFTGSNYKEPPAGKVRLHLLGSLYPGKFHDLCVPTDEASTEDKDESSGPVRLFPPCCREKFIITEDVSLGRIMAIVLQTEVASRHSSWDCQSVIVRDLSTNEAWYFLAKCKIGFPPVVLEAATVESLTTFKLSWQRRIRREVRQGQYVYFGFWFRFAYKNKQSVYTFLQRHVTAITCQIHIFSICLLFIGLILPPEITMSHQHHGTEILTGAEGEYWVSHAIIVGVISSVVTSLIGFVVVTLFREKSQYENHLEEMDYVIGTALHEHDQVKRRHLMRNCQHFDQVLERCNSTLSTSTSSGSPSELSPLVVPRRGSKRKSNVPLVSVAVESKPSVVIPIPEFLITAPTPESKQSTTVPFSNGINTVPMVGSASNTSEDKQSPMKVDDSVVTILSPNELGPEVSKSGFTAGSVNAFTSLNPFTRLGQPSPSLPTDTTIFKPSPAQGPTETELTPIEEKSLTSSLMDTVTRILYWRRTTKVSPSPTKANESELPEPVATAIPIQKAPEEEEEARLGETSESAVQNVKLAEFTSKHDPSPMEITCTFETMVHLNLPEAEPSPSLSHLSVTPSPTSIGTSDFDTSLPSPSSSIIIVTRKSAVTPTNLAQFKRYKMRKLFLGKREPREIALGKSKLNSGTAYLAASSLTTSGSLPTALKVLHHHRQRVSRGRQSSVRGNESRATTIEKFTVNKEALEHKNQEQLRRFPKPYLAWVAVLFIIVVSFCMVISTLGFIGPKLQGHGELFFHMFLTTYLTALIFGTFVMETVKMGLIGAYYAYKDKSIYSRIGKQVKPKRKKKKQKRKMRLTKQVTNGNGPRQHQNLELCKPKQSSKQ